MNNYIIIKLEILWTVSIENCHFDHFDSAGVLRSRYIMQILLISVRFADNRESKPRVSAFNGGNVIS